MKKIISAAFAATLIMSGCGSEPLTPEEQYIKDFRANMEVEEGVTDNRIISAGKSLCDVYAVAGYSETVDFLMELGAKNEDAAIDTLSSLERHIC